MSGVINLYKTSGLSSSEAVETVRHILGTKEVGHFGTLDPMAQGVLPIGIGKGTKLFDLLLKKEKTYTATVSFGFETATFDAFGEITRTAPLKNTSEVIATLPELVGAYKQIPPLYSAKHVNGKRAYALAASGKAPKLDGVPITVFGIEPLEVKEENGLCESISLKIDCSSSTYIRAIARDLAEKVGSAATLTYLRRDKSGIFNLDNAVSIKRLREVKEEAVIPLSDVLDKLMPRYEVPASSEKELANGVKLPAEFDGYVAVYCNDTLYGIGINENNHLKLKTYLKEG